MNKLTLSQRIVLITAVLSLALAGLGAFAALRFAGLNASVSRIINDPLPGMLAIDRIKTRQSRCQDIVQEMTRVNSAEERRKLRAEIGELSAANSEDYKKYEQTIVADEDRVLF